MFREQYHRDNEHILPTPEMRERVVDSLRAAAAHNTTPLTAFTRRVTRRTVCRAAALAACLALVAGSVLYMDSRRSPLSAKPDVEVVKPTEAADYGEVYAVLQKIAAAADEDDFLYAENGDGTFADIGDLPGESGGTRSDSGYSETNVQVAGVDEADVIKTDGDYLYLLRDNRVKIVDAAGAESVVVGEIDCLASGIVGENRSYEAEDLYEAVEMYLHGDRLTVLLCKTVFRYYLEQETAVLVYDIADRTAPALLEHFTQSGAYVTSRRMGDILYTVSSHEVYNNMTEEKTESYVPQVSTGADGCVMQPRDIWLPKEANANTYTVLTAVNLAGKPARVSQKAVLCDAETVYVNGEHLLLAEGRYEAAKYGTWRYTDLHLFTLKDGLITAKASAKVEGHLLNQFSVDVHKGYFRLAVKRRQVKKTEEDYQVYRDTALYVLDGGLRLTGSITGIAEGETLRAARFDGDIGYLVTFLQTDPLFTVDLSDPAEPKLLGELKIPGFSRYLHPFGEGLLFGLGSAADNNGRVTGLKLSMFDVSDKTNVTEITTEEPDAAYSEAQYNHKAIVISVERGLIAFPVSDGYCIYRYDAEEGFQMLRSILLEESNGYELIRGAYIGEHFYVCGKSALTVYDMEEFTKLADVILI